MAEVIEFPKRPEYETLEDIIRVLRVAQERPQGTVGISLSMVISIDGQTHPMFFQADASDIAFAALQLQTQAMFAGGLLVEDPE